MKKSLLATDWIIALGLSLLLLLSSHSQWMQAIERMAYDIGMQLSHREPGHDIAVIAIDDESIHNIGRWPWSRQVHATLIQQLTSAKVIGHTVFFLEPQVDQGLAYINQLQTKLQHSSIANSTDGHALNTMLEDAQRALNADVRLADSIAQANNVVLTMPFKLGVPNGKPDGPLPDYITRQALTNVVDRTHAIQHQLTPTSALKAYPPIAPIASQARAIGHLNQVTDVDGAVRVEPLVLQYFDQYYPSLALQVAARYLNLTAQDIQVQLGQGVQVGKLNIQTNNALQMHSFFYTSPLAQTPFPTDSFYDVYSGKIPASKYQGKIVLIGMAATGDGGDTQITPISAHMQPIQTLAHHIASILNEDFFITPTWALFLEYTAWLSIGLYLMFLLTRLSASTAAGVSLCLGLLLVTMHLVFMTQYGWWVQLMMPCVLLLLGHALLISKQYWLTERGKRLADAESSESNRNLALMLQSQGQLDMAFDRFRKCLLEDNLMDSLYHLGLDFERKRQFNKATQVFSYMAQHNPHFKDLTQRIATSRQLSETIVLGGQSGLYSDLSSADGTLSKPMLGRYQIEKELGKGAMGTVYLGVDPKIGRQVAIKTLALSQAFEASELEAVKARFFREAETAGKLNHPNIVTIYDAGEEHDLAYIAMELLKGHDLNPYTKLGQLLPLDTVLNIMIKVAGALDYAHQQHVIHRDVKPANIMYEPDTQSVKVTDFGIARITDTSKTKTGMVLGTPNFMSPEQLSGKKLDGRSDLFSLGTTMYQLTTGELPFEGDSMANLMYNISQATPKTAIEINPDIPLAISNIIQKLLEKDVQARYQNGQALAADLHSCLQSLAR
ncbi:serine/threonine-protein kinase [Methylotenera sp. 1P/1]|uniref:serine/threonine-protein kinase n=1 Tax=Methylotenera sp. 1P/1 TaxID=1131551 RepID=UPI0003A0E256|nr:serine/threonine-protein kinase [Methylotenera sp. 1P/1]